MFLKRYSYHSKAAFARLRIALSYDILDRNFLETKHLYKNTINRSQNLAIRYEAGLRYIGLTNLRKRKPNAKDRELRVFLEIPGPLKKNLSKNLKKLLWLTRLRLFITDENFQDALKYLDAIPVTSLAAADMHVFEADGSEIVLGKMMKNLKEGNYAEIIKLHSLYKNKYTNKVGRNPFVKFVLAKSYLKLGLYKGFDNVISSFKSFTDGPLKTYPNWLNINTKQMPISELVLELRVIRNIKLANWNAARKVLRKMRSVSKNKTKVSYYDGVVAFGVKDYKKTSLDIENFFSSDDSTLILDRSENANLIRIYTTALYKTKKFEKYLRIENALTQNPIKDSKMKSIRERVSYMAIEILARKKGALSRMELIKKIIKFKKYFKKSSYMGRVSYLLSLVMISQKRISEGKKILNKLLNSKNVPKNIKELARTELSLLKIRDKTI